MITYPTGAQPWPESPNPWTKMRVDVWLSDGLTTTDFSIFSLLKLASIGSTKYGGKCEVCEKNHFEDLVVLGRNGE